MYLTHALTSLSGSKCKMLHFNGLLNYSFAGGNGLCGLLSFHLILFFSVFSVLPVFNTPSCCFKCSYVTYLNILRRNRRLRFADIQQNGRCFHLVAQHVYWVASRFVIRPSSFGQTSFPFNQKSTKEWARWSDILQNSYFWRTIE